MPINYGTNTHYGCGHPRTKENSIGDGTSRFRCKTCTYEQKKRQRQRQKDEANGYARLLLPLEKRRQSNLSE